MLDYISVMCIFFLFLFNYTASYSITLVRYLELDNKIPKKGTKLHDNVECIQDCASCCLGTLLCRGILYRHSDKLCLSYDASLGSSFTTDPLPGVLSYVKRQTECEKLGYIDVGLLCYKLSDIKMTWQEGRDACRNQSGDLIVLNTEQKWKLFLKSSSYFDKVQTNYLIGLSDVDNEGSFMWVDGTSAANLSHVLPTEFNNLFRGEHSADCGRIDIKNVILRDDGCSFLRNFVCEIRFPN